MDKSKDGMGAYQCRVREPGWPIPPAFHLQERPDLTESDRASCGDIWGTQCKTWVYPPWYSHDTHPDLNTRTKRAASSDTPVKVLEHLAVDPTPTVRSAVAGNPAVPVELLEKLVSDDNMWVRQAVAQHPSTPPRVLEDLALDAVFWVQMRIAGNVNSTVRALTWLAANRDPMIASAACANPSLPEYLRILVRSTLPR